MTDNFSVSGAAALLAVAACGQDTDENVTFAFDYLSRSVAFDMHGAATDAPSGNMRVEVQRTFSRPGTYRYHCTIHPGTNGAFVIE